MSDVYGLAQRLTLQPLPAIFDRVLAEKGRYQLEPLVHGQRHRVTFDAGGGLA